MPIAKFEPIGTAPYHLAVSSELLCTTGQPIIERISYDSF